MTKKLNFRLFSFLLILAISPLGLAEISPQGSIAKGDYEVHYSLFPSTFIKPEIAAAYKLKRSKYETLLNISVTPKGEYGGLEAGLSGTTTNMLQQQKQLKFIEIKEENVVYYLAPVRISGEEIIKFSVDVNVKEASAPFTIKFSSKLYSDK
ncbi:protein of unknown function [Alteromonadaceae bacterium Bs31]|nr:protein of unknown function [Alteromonadaceae bacterium Bs31]